MNTRFSDTIENWPIEELNRDPWLPLPPKCGKGGTNETPLNYQAFQVHLQQPLAERSLDGTARILRKHPSLLERWSSQFYWRERGDAWDRRLAEIAATERIAGAVEATRKDNEKQNSRWLEVRERVWGQLQQILGNIEALAARPIMQVRSVKKAVADPKTETDAREITTIVNPGLDLLRAIHYQTELAQLCFGDVTFPEDGVDSSDEVVAGEVHLRPGYTPEEPAPFDAATGQPERPKR